MIYLSLGEASKAANVSKSTISKSLKSGRLSYVEKTSAGYRIDPSELFRVFPKKQAEIVSSERFETPSNTSELAVLRVRLEAAEKLALSMKEERDAWREQAQRLALVDQRISEPVKTQKGFWSRFWGR